MSILNVMSGMLVPMLLLYVSCYGTMKGVDVYTAMVRGAKEGLVVMWNIVPSLITLLTAVTMLRVSGALDVLAWVMGPVLRVVNVPVELVPLMFIRPLSGSGALGVGAELMESYGPDSMVGRMASVMLGSTETTFYTIAVYFGAASITKTRYAIPAALMADFTGFLASVILVRLLF